MNIHINSDHGGLSSHLVRRVLPADRARPRFVILIAVLAALLIVALVIGSLVVFAAGDLVVTFSSAPSPAPFRAGTSHSFQVTVHNGEPDPPAEAVEFQYRAPAGVVITSIVSSVGPCEVGTEGDPSDPSICSLGNMGSTDVTVDITVYVLPDVPHGTLLDHDVRAWQTWTEENPFDNENHAFVTVEAEADLSVSKIAEGDVVTGYDDNTFEDILTPTPNVVTAGELIKYTATITNAGPSDAQNVVVSDTLPAKFDFIESVPAGCWANAANPLLVTCLLDTMPATTTQQLELVVRTRPDAAIDDPDDGDNERTATNNVEVSSDTAEPTSDPTPNTFALPVTVNARANLQITKTDIPDPVLAGEEVKYIITAKNLGPSKSRAVVITDTLPSGLVFVRCEPVDPDEVPVCSYDQAANTVTLTDFRIEGLLRDDLMPDEVRAFRIVAYARSNLVKEPDLYNEPDAVGNLVTITDTVFITDVLDITDWYAANNTDRELTGVTSEADLAVRKTDTPNPTPDDGYLIYDPVTNSFIYTYTITVENLGPSDAGRVILTDTLPIYASLDMVGGDPMTAIDAPTARDVRFRDDGVVIVDWGQIAGNDDRRDDLDLTNPLNPSLPTTRTLTIRVRVDADVAPDIGFLENRVEVTTVPGDVCPTQLGTPVCPDPWPHGYTPTPDPDLSNNVYIEYTALVAPEVKVDKKVYVRKSLARDIDVTTDGLTEVERCETYATDDILTLPGDEVTYCYLITNEGDSWLHSITLEDLSDPLIYRAPTTDFTVVDPSPAPARWDPPPYVSGAGEAQTITIKTTYAEVAVLSPKGVPDPDGYDHILIIRSFTVDFPELGSIAGVVWEDKNENHVVDLGEPLLAGMEVDLFYESGFPLALDTRTTGADGRYAFHGVAPGKYKVRVRDPGPPSVLLGVLPVIEFDPPKGYSIANLDVLTGEWYIESEEYSEPIFRMLGTNTARVDTIPSTKYSTPLPGIEPSGDCVDPNLVCDTDLLHDTLALPVLEDTTKEWAIYEDNGDDLPSPNDVIEYTVDIPNTGIIEATEVEFYDGLYNWINDDADDLKVPGWLINGSVSAAIHVYGREPDTGRVIDADLQPPDLAFGEDLLLRTYAPAIGGGYLELTYPSAIVLDSEILKGNTSGDDEVQVATRLAIPPVGYLLRFDGVTYDPPIPVTFSLRIKYRVLIKETKYVRLGTIVLSHGWVTYNEIGLFDDRFPDFDPTDPGLDAYTADNKVANYHAGTPGQDWDSPEFPGWPEIPPDVEPTNYLGDRFDDYALPGAPIRNDDDPTWFKLVREPRRIQLPAIDHEDGWETQIQVQNGGDDNTGVIVFFWGEYSGMCPYSDPGPIGYACKWVAENGLWSLEDQIIPSTAKSAIVYSVDENLFDEACADAAGTVNDSIPSLKWRAWEDDYEGTGEPIAVIVQRAGPNDFGTMVSSAYPGISENSAGGGPEYQYFAPYAMRQYHNLDTEMIIHNSGQRCTEVWLEYQKQGDDGFSYEERVTQLAPGESIRKRVPAVLGAEWLGSIYVTANEPLGIVVDQTSFLPSDDRGTLLTYEARPYKLTTDTLFYADLVWRELSGWEASIQVQNLTQHSLPTFVTVEFFDASGDSILFLGDWVPRAGGTTFYLPAVTDLGMGYAGAAVIQSHQQVDYPGQHHPNGEPIFAVVDLKKTKMYDEALHRWRHTIAGEIQGGAYNALAEGEKKEASAVMLPFLAKAKNDQGVTSLMAIRNNSNCNQIELKLEVRKGTGTVVSYVHIFNLPPGHIKLIDLANVGSVNPGFVGAGAVRILHVNQLCDVDNDGYMDETPTMLSVVVVNKGAGSGDITSVYEGIPVAYWGFP